MAARPGRDGRRAWDLDRVLVTLPWLAALLGEGGGQLSGGEQQMLTVGGALMTNPELIILDEATEGLAPLVGRDIWAVIRGIRQGGGAVVSSKRIMRASMRSPTAASSSSKALPSSP